MSAAEKVSRQGIFLLAVTFVSLAVLNVFLLVTNHRLRSSVRTSGRTVESIATQIISLEHQLEGRQLPSVSINSLNGNRFAFPAVLPRQFTLLALFSGNDCSRCLAMEASNLRSLHRASDPKQLHVLAIFSLMPRSQIYRYKTVYSLEFPLWVDADGKLLSALKLFTTPVIFLLNANHRVVYAHISNYAAPERSEHFFNKVKSLGSAAASLGNSTKGM